MQPLEQSAAQESFLQTAPDVHHKQPEALTPRLADLIGRPWWTASGVSSPMPECKVLFVVPREEVPAEASGVLDASEPFRGSRADTLGS